MKTRFILTVLILSFLVFSWAQAYVASSPHYELQVDSINVGGVDYSTSTSYSMNDTIGEISTGSYTSASNLVQAGYQAMVGGDVTISISAPDNVTLSPAIDGLSGGQSNGSATWNVITNDSAGYSLLIKSSGSPALTSSTGNFSDYSTANAGIPDYDWNVSNTLAAFGYSVFSPDSVASFKNDGSHCNTGSSNSSSHCWFGFSPSNTEIARGSGATPSQGTNTEIDFKAELGSNKIIPAGTYSSAITVTALPL